MDVSTSSWFNDLVAMSSSIGEESLPFKNGFSFIGDSDSRLISAAPMAEYIIKEKTKYIKQVLAAITATTQEFQKKCSGVECEIKKATKEIILNANLRERYLLAELEKKTRPSIQQWVRQLEICSDALRWLENADKKIFDAVSNEEFEEWFHQKFTRHMQELHEDSVEFESAGTAVVLAIQNMGRIYNAKSRAGRMPKIVLGAAGQDPGQFCRPWGVCTDGMGRILVADRSNHRVQIFGESGEFLLQFGKLGSQPGEFHTPSGVAVDRESRIVVADKDNHRVQVFTSSGAFLSTFGRRGTGSGEFDHPWDVAVNGKCEIAVSDSKNHRIQLFDTQGVALAICDFRNGRINSKEMVSPRGLAFRPDGKLFVTDFDNHNVLLLDSGLKTVLKFGREGKSPGEFFRPQGIACNEKGKFAVADCKNHRIQVFDSNGSLLEILSAHGNAPGKLDSPQGVCFHPNGNLIVVDFGNSRVQIF